TKSPFAKNWIETKYSAFIKDKFSEKLGKDINLRILLINEEEQAKPIITAETLPAKPVQKSKQDEEPISLPLNSKYNFDNFVVGPNNRLAHACAVSIAENPGKTYNPLFIYGGAGLGKTHLMHALGITAQASKPNMKVVYVSGETFTFHYVTALKEQRTSSFRKRYRNVDLWLVDDIQFLAGKERTEEEFFHTFNALYDMGKQIVLTSDRAPKDLELDRRLLSRFESGMLSDIRPPDLETRMAILQSKAETEKMALSDEVILYIARLITNNIRQLEGALIKLHAYASLMRTDVTKTLAEEILGEYFTNEVPNVIDVSVVQKAVADRFNINVSELSNSSRQKDIVLPRQTAMYIAREITGASLPAIGKAFGGRDHTTVMHACKKIEEKLSQEKDFASLVEDLLRSIENRKTC
ncbi:MAG: chromosomal replication initiator protein DnaA, partial [Armatimonadota bacterium]